MLCVVSVHANSKTFVVHDYGEIAMNKTEGKFLPPYSYDLDPGFIVQQNANTLGDVKLTVKYKDSQNNWVSAWCKTFSYRK